MIKKVHVVYYKPHDKEEKLTLNTVYRVLKANKIQYKATERKLFYKYSKDLDLIIVVGGDGTFLRASHIVHDIPMFGVNSHCGKKEGFLMHCTKLGFGKKFRKLLKGFKTTKLLRLDIKINNKKLYPALNDVFVGHKLPYKLSRFDLIVTEKKTVKKEHQKCSGLIVSTAAGSNAWAVGAGGKVMPLTSKRWQYVVREQYEGKLHKHKLGKGILGDQGQIKVKILRPGYILSVDSQNYFKLKQGDVITISPSKKPLNYTVI